MDVKGKLDTFLLSQSDANIANIHLSAKCPGSSACSHLSMLLDSRGPQLPQGLTARPYLHGNKLKV